MKIPTSQNELIRMVRDDLTQAEFARVLGVDRSCLSRYESEALGAPTSVINHCLVVLAQKMNSTVGLAWPVSDALLHARSTVEALERLNIRNAD